MNKNGKIEPHCLYKLTEFKQLTGLGAHAMRTARRNGLRVRYLGGKAFVHSDDFFEYLEKIRDTGQNQAYNTSGR